MTNIRKIITNIVQSEGESIEDEELYLYIEVEDPDENLSIERHGDVLIVCQYYTQNRDLMRDPEVKFRIEDQEWIPFACRMDSTHSYEYDSDRIEIDDFLQTWAVNLKRQFL